MREGAWWGEGWSRRRLAEAPLRGRGDLIPKQGEEPLISLILQIDLIGKAREIV